MGRNAIISLEIQEASERFQQRALVELPDNLSDEEIEEEYQNWANVYIYGGWERLEK